MTVAPLCLLYPWVTATTERVHGFFNLVTRRPFYFGHWLWGRSVKLDMQRDDQTVEDVSTTYGSVVNLEDHSFFGQLLLTN